MNYICFSLFMSTFWSKNPSLKRALKCYYLTVFGNFLLKCHTPLWMTYFAKEKNEV